jgi:hypothetical protein
MEPSNRELKFYVYIIISLPNFLLLLIDSLPDVGVSATITILAEDLI